MQSKATTVDAYIKQLPEDRREVIESVRKVILKNLDKSLKEGMQYGMIGYFVPHSVFPPGYHCDPKQPLPYAGLAAQKNAYSLYMFCMYGNEKLHQELIAAYKAIGKKPDIGKACIRFKSIDDLPLEPIGKLIKAVTAKKHIDFYTQTIDARNKSKPAAAKKAGGAKKKAKKIKKKAAAKK